MIRSKGDTSQCQETTTTTSPVNSDDAALKNGGRCVDSRTTRAALRQEVEIEEEKPFDFGLNAREKRSRFGFAFEDDIKVGAGEKVRQERTNPRHANRVQEFRGWRGKGGRGDEGA